MRPTALAIAVLAVTILSSSPVAAVDVSGGSAADRARMLEISEQWLAAYASGDLDALMAIMHRDAMVMPHNQPTSRGTDEVRDYFRTRIGRPGVEFVDDLAEIRINGDWAYVLGAFSLRVDRGPEQPPYVHHGRYLVLYEKVDGDWKMLRDMDNAVPAGTD
ncbi:MAG: DUF4440 domain-containing protein [Woeseiaceae bacterium]|nr:DUF4440 domain-containing protein [Woeseiaceae bacterium]